MSEAEDGFDYIVVGAGSVGCVLAARLSEDPACRVALVEAGGRDRHWRYRMPLAWNQSVGRDESDWGYASEPEPHAGDRSIPAPRGKLLGGCSSINGMMYSRGHAADYDGWAKRGARGWAWEDVLPYFKRSEHNWRGPSALHGNGALEVSRLHALDAPFTAATLETAKTLGYPVLDDFAAADEGFSVPDFTVGRGVRSSSAYAFLRPALRRTNLKVFTGALCTGLSVEGSRASGVTIDQGGRQRTLRAAGEVILCAGTFNSPQLLMLAGIGPADALRALGIACRANLPGVGANLQDHGSIGTAWALARPIGYERALRFDRLALSVLQWALARTGEAASFPFGAQGFVTLDPASPGPDLQFLTTPTAMLARPWFPGLRSGAGHQLSTVGMLLHPESRGSVALRSADPRAKPAIRFNLLAEPADRLAFRRILQWTREFLATEPMAGLLADELMPGPTVRSYAEQDAWIRDNLFTAMHPVGTCAIGTVVDPELRVHGIEGLRVADCSIMPTIVGGNTNAPALMIAEKAADMIRRRETVA